MTKRDVLLLLAEKYSRIADGDTDILCAGGRMVMNRLAGRRSVCGICEALDDIATYSPRPIPAVDAIYGTFTEITEAVFGDFANYWWPIRPWRGAAHIRATFCCLAAAMTDKEFADLAITEI